MNANSPEPIRPRRWGTAASLLAFSLLLCDRAALAQAPPASSTSPKAAKKAPAAKEAPRTPAAPADPAAQPSPPPTEVQVQGQRSEAQRLRESAEAVTVVDTQRAKKQTRDLGDVLSSVEGVNVRRTGGLGSFSRFYLNGLFDTQVRFFFNGVPLEVAGYPFGVSNVPLSLVDRVDIYRGVVPIRFGADALGGAVNLIPDKRYDTKAYASYQTGSFGTMRATLGGRYHNASSGFVIGTEGWFDSARNDYQIEAPIADARGKETLTPVRLLHNAYRGYGGSLEFGFVDRPWADRLLVRLFGMAYDKQIPADLAMTIPYGEVTYGAGVLGGTVNYDVSLLKTLSLSAVGGYSRKTIDAFDHSPWNYDWYGHRVAKALLPSEVSNTPHDSTIWQDTPYGNLQLAWNVAPEHTIRLATSVRYTTRTGNERATTTLDGSDPLAGRRNLSAVVTGLEYELNALDMRSAKDRAKPSTDPARDDRFQNSLFVKHYFYGSQAKHMYIIVTSKYQDVDISDHRFGIGDGLRFRFTDWLSVKASYELTTRIPSADEFYGDGLLVFPNPDLVPETSNNGNLALVLNLKRTPIGAFASETGGFVRAADRLIVQLADQNYGVSQYKNLASARTVGIEESFSWRSPKDWVVLDGNLTFLDSRNTSTDGPFLAYYLKRIPNRPWFFANWAARVQWRNALMPGDELAPYYIGRYIHDFFRSWELPVTDPKSQLIIIPAQLAHSVGISYSTNLDPLRCTTTLEVDNLTDATLYDFFGAQKPGRSVALKVTGEL